MKTKIILFHLVIAAMLFTSCQKDTDIFIPDTTSIGLDTNWVSSITDLAAVSEVKRLLRKENFLDSLDATAGGTVQTSEGLTVIVLPASLQLSNGQLATGKIYVETMLVKQRGDMVRLNKPTTSFGRILVSGGEIFVTIRKENEELHLAPGKTIYIKYNDSNPSSLMKLFYGDESDPQRFNWVQSTLNGSAAIGANSQGYEIVTDRLRWINCDYFADSLGSRVNVTASLPADYTNANTFVYLVFKDIKSVAGMYGDVASKKFSSSKVPNGKAAVVISITKKGTNSYYLGHETITTGQTSLNGVQTVPLKPQPTSLSDIKAYLSTL
ncbi:MAG: hypothetical protein JWN83_627 [Chitinophagaceae bacterium]|nr:hypothetical protein [Chitinophagaceae bacterium]